jgi:hypothetical protein
MQRALGHTAFFFPHSRARESVVSTGHVLVCVCVGVCVCVCVCVCV